MKPNANRFSNLLAEIVTQEDRSLFMDEVSRLEAGLFSGGEQGFATVMTKQVRQRIAVAYGADFKEYKQGSEQFLTEVKQVVAELPEMDITVAHELTVTEYSALAEKVRQVAGRPLVLSVSINPFILAGMQLSFGGKYGDYSLRRRLEAEFETGLGEG